MARPYGWSPWSHAPPSLGRLSEAWRQGGATREGDPEPQRSDRMRSPNSRRQGLVLSAQAGADFDLRRSTRLSVSTKTSSGWRAASTDFPHHRHSNCVRRWRVRPPKLDAIASQQERYPVVALSAPIRRQGAGS